MNKLFLFFILGLIIATPFIVAKDIEVIIEQKNPQIETTQFIGIKTMSVKSIEIKKSKYEIKTISKKEFENLKKDKSILIQENIPKRILMDLSTPLIEADTVWNIKQNSTNVTGQGQTVCILDTGAQTSHLSLIGKNATCNIDCASDACIENCTKTDSNGHGTHVAGTIVSTHSTYKGVTQNTKYIPVMVCNSSGNCDNPWVLDGLDWCIANKDIYNISVISMSLGGGQFSSYCDASEPSFTSRFDQAVAMNISVVTATGNLGNLITNNSAGISSPSCIQSAIRVGNTDDLDNMVSSGLRHNFFSDIITAPGADICSTRLPGDNSGTLCGDGTFIRKAGTSMSTPHVSGAITLLNHYKKLESNKYLTPSKIRTLLFNSGKRIYDTETNQNYSRIDIYQAILFSDELAPNITDMIPSNNKLVNPTNTTFICNATDNLQFANLTIKIYNSTSLIFNKSTINQSITTSQNLTEGDYNWTCKATDNQSNSNETIYHLTASSIQTNIISPKNNFYENKNKTIFNCSSQTTKELVNMTFYLYQNDSLIYNRTNEILGKSNSSIFSYNLTNETNYKYYCKSINNQSQEANTNNYTIIYDKTSPTINLSTPINNTRSTLISQTFIYSEYEINSNYCNLTINEQVMYSFTQTLSVGNYSWYITCTDLANNSNTSKTWQLEIYTTPITYSGGSSSGGSSSGGSFKSNIYLIEEEEMLIGAEQKLKIKDAVNFKTNSQNHKLTLNKIEDGKANITIESTPINFIIYLNSPVKLDLNKDEIFDLEITLLEVNNYAKFFLREINDIIPQKTIYTLENKTKEKSIENKIIPEEKYERNTSFFNKIIIKFMIKKDSLFILPGIIVLISIFFIIELLKSKKLTKKEEHHNIGKHKKNRLPFISIQRVPIKNIKYNESKKIKIVKTYKKEKKNNKKEKEKIKKNKYIK